MLTAAVTAAIPLAPPGGWSKGWVAAAVAVLCLTLLVIESRRELWLLATGRYLAWHRARVPVQRAALWAKAGMTAEDYTAWDDVLGWDSHDHPEHVKAARDAGVTPDQVRALPGRFNRQVHFGPAFAAGLTCDDLCSLYRDGVPERLLNAIIVAVARQPALQHREEVLAWATSAPLTPQDHGDGSRSYPTFETVAIVVREWRHALGPQAYLFAGAGLTLDEAVAMRQAPAGADAAALTMMAALRTW